MGTLITGKREEDTQQYGEGPSFYSSCVLKEQLRGSAFT